MKDYYEDQAVWCTVDKDSGSIRIGSTMLDKARRLANNHSFFVARWDVSHLMWIHAPEPPATVNVVLTVEQAEWITTVEWDLTSRMTDASDACRKALDARDAS